MILLNQIKEDGEQLESRIIKLEQIYNYYHEERTFTRKAAFQQNRKRYYLKGRWNNSTSLRSIKSYG